MKFSRFTQLMRLNSRPDKEQIRKDVLKSCKPKWIKPTAVITSIVLTAGIIGAGGLFLYENAPRGKDNHLPEELKPLSTVCAVTAEGNQDSLPTDSVFEITTQKATDINNLKNSLKVYPDCDYTLKKTSGNTFDLTFDRGMKENTLYRISSTVDGKELYSWAFQTETEFKITDHSRSTEENSSLLWVEFSHSDVQNLEQYFSITPAISGTFEKYANRWIFIPSSEFAEGTVYTVSISGDVITDSGEVLGEDYIFNFVSRGQKWCDFYYKDADLKCDTFTTSQNPAGKISYSGINVAKIGVDVYSIPTAEEFINIHKMYVKDGNTSDAVIHALAQPMLSFETETLNFENDSYAYFGYPQRLTAGRYISVITVDGYRTFHFFQINDTAVYPVSSGGDTAIWVTDSASGRLLSGIPVTSDGGASVNTDSSGIANIKGQSAVGTAYYVIGSSTPYVCMAKLNEKDVKAELTDKYNPYILTDSTSYNAKDTVKIKGFTDISNASPESVELYCSFDGKIIAADVDKNGLIAEEITLPDKSLETGYIDLVIDGITVDTVFLKLNKDTREVYNVTVTTDKPSYVAGETVEYTFYAELADKTPADNVAIVSADTVIVTNSRGIATFSEQVINAGEISREFTVNQPDRQTQIYADYTVHPSGYFIKEVKDTNTALTLVAGFADGFDDETETEVTLELHRIYYQSSDNTAYFNPVTMQKEYTMRAYAVDEVVSTKQVSYDMRTPIPYTIPADNNTYYMRITWGPSVYYHLISNREDTVIDSENRYTFVSRNEISKGDTLNVSVLPYDNEEILSGKVMVCALTDGISQTICSDMSSISFEFTDKTVLAGAYFDGKVIYPIDSKTVLERNETLDIALETEKENYLPADTVNGSITVTKDGIAQESFVNIKVTDNEECIFFETVATDIAGKADFSVTLPDRIGDYTVTVTGIANGIEGHATEKISASKDYYITPFIEKNISANDDASFAFRVTAEPTSEHCSYSISLFKDGIQLKTLEGTADYDQVKNESFGKLEAGHYTVTISSGDGMGQDSVSCEFDVTEPIITDASRTTSSNISGISGDIRVHLYDAETELYFSVTDKMLALCDSAPASIFARIDALQKMGIEKPFDLSGFFTGEGLKYADGSYATADDAAIISTVINDKYDTSAILPYFDGIEAGFPDTSSLINVYLIKAANREPVLDELNIIYKQADTLEDSSLLRLALAYTYAGDSAKAWDIIDGISPKIRSANGTATYAADTPVESDYLSCLSAIVTSKLSHTFAKELVKGVMNGVDCELLGLAYYCYTEYYIPHNDGKNTVLYKKADGSEEILTYRRAIGLTLDFSNEEYKKVSFESKEGDTLIMLSGVAGIPHQFDNASVISASVSQTEITDGDRFTVTLDIDTTVTEVKSPYGVFKLPHGIKLIDSKIVSGEGKILGNGSNIEIYYSGDIVTAQLTCYAAIEGEYTIQAPILIDVSGEKYMSGTDTTVSVK